MKKKVNRRSSVAELLETPLPMGASPLPNDSPRSAIFINKKATASASKVNKDTSLPSATKTLSSISDLKDLASSRLDHLKRHIDHSHSEILKDLDASQSRLHKRFKVSLSHVYTNTHAQSKKIASALVWHVKFFEERLLLVADKTEQEIRKIINNLLR